MACYSLEISLVRTIEDFLKSSIAKDSASNVSLTAKDSASNAKLWIITFVKDTIMPVMTIPFPANGTHFDAAFNFQANVFDFNFANITCQVDAMAIRLFTMNVSTLINGGDWTSLSQGTHQITITATDLAGKTKLGNITFVKDTGVFSIVIQDITAHAVYVCGQALTVRVMLDASTCLYDITSGSLTLQITPSTGYALNTTYSGIMILHGTMARLDDDLGLILQEREMKFRVVKFLSKLCGYTINIVEKN